MKILLNAVPFGYGPVSKIAAIAKRLREENVEITFCGHGIAYEFMEREKICKLVYLDVYTEKGAKELGQMLSQFDYALTCMDPDFIRVCYKKVGLPLGYVDSLSWMWDESHFNNSKEIAQVDHYFIQNTFSADANILKFNIKNPIFINGIIDVQTNGTSPVLEKGDNVVIHFGGVENIYVPVNDIIYPFKVMAVINELNHIWKNYSNVIVVCSEKISSRLRESFPTFKGEFLSVNHSEFINIMKNSKLFLTTPGLTTLLEAFSLDITTLFLPPQNFSQYLILDKLKDNGYPVELLNWDFFYPEFNIPLGTPEQVAVSQVKDCTENFFEDADKMKRFKYSLEEMIGNYESHVEIKDFQRVLIKEIGNDGIGDIVDVILNHCKNIENA